MKKAMKKKKSFQEFQIYHKNKKTTTFIKAYYQMDIPIKTIKISS